MVGVLILTHGGLALELLDSARRVVARDLEQFSALPLEWSDGIPEGLEKVEVALRDLDTGDGVLILTDIFGGTPSNVAARFRDPGRIEIVAGVNLPIVVRLGCQGARALPVEELAAWIRDKGKSSICWSSDLPRTGEKPLKALSCENSDG